MDRKGTSLEIAQTTRCPLQDGQNYLLADSDTESEALVPSVDLSEAEDGEIITPAGREEPPSMELDQLYQQMGSEEERQLLGDGSPTLEGQIGADYDDLLYGEFEAVLNLAATSSLEAQ